MECLTKITRLVDLAMTSCAVIKRYAIVKAVTELNEKADMHIEWKETKRGRSVYSLQFTFTFTFVKKEKAVQGELEL